MHPGKIAYYAHRTRNRRATGYDLCVLTSSPIWKTLYFFTLPPNRSNITNACKAPRMKELVTKWIFTVCLKVFREHHKPHQSFILLMNVFFSPTGGFTCCLWLRDTELELHSTGSPGSKLSPVGPTA